jgi:hypothetical protein
MAVFFVFFFWHGEEGGIRKDFHAPAPLMMMMTFFLAILIILTNNQALLSYLFPIYNEFQKYAIQWSTESSHFFLVLD